MLRDYMRVVVLSTIVAGLVAASASMYVYLSERKQSGKFEDIRYERLAKENEELEMRLLKLEATVYSYQKYSQEAAHFSDTKYRNIMTRVDLLKSIVDEMRANIPNINKNDFLNMEENQ